jgi:lysozyme family protein
MWAKCAVKPGKDATNTEFYAKKIIASEGRYRVVQANTGVPWFFIGALHMRESGCDFNGVLHNGEHIIGTGKKTKLVPAGRGPFRSWEEAAEDALAIKGYNKITEWPVDRMAYCGEAFNGWGYANKHINSPYLWAGSTNEQLGKYVADHVWNGSFDDPQIGVMTVLRRLAQLRPDIDLALNGPVETQVPGAGVELPRPPAFEPAPAPAPEPPPVKEPVAQPKVSFWSSLLSAIVNAFLKNAKSK